MLVDKNKCCYCGGCVSTCPQDALELQEVVLVVDKNKCVNCGICAKFCPVGAITIEK